MNFKKAMKNVGASLGGGVIGAAFASVAGGVSAATGAAIFSGAGYANHIAKEAVKASALGNGIIGAAAGIAGSALLMQNGFFRAVDGQQGDILNNLAPKETTKTYLAMLASHVPLQVLGGVVGYELLAKIAGSAMTLGSVTADVAVGSALTAAPMTIGLLCCLGLVAAGAHQSLSALRRGSVFADREPLLPEREKEPQRESGVGYRAMGAPVV